MWRLPNPKRAILLRRPRARQAGRHDQGYAYAGGASRSAKVIEFFFDFGSPTTYLAHTQVPRLAADSGARVEYVPMLLGGVFRRPATRRPRCRTASSTR
jgi:hypothetical protein